jgi:hypothetical protein
LSSYWLLLYKHNHEMLNHSYILMTVCMSVRPRVTANRRHSYFIFSVSLRKLQNVTDILQQKRELNC